MTPLQVLAWAAVGLRLYTRFRVVRAPGWDDLFIVLALVRTFAIVTHTHWKLYPDATVPAGLWITERDQLGCWYDFTHDIHNSLFLGMSSYISSNKLWHGTPHL